MSLAASPSPDPPAQPTADAPTAPRPLIRIDPGWLFLIAGILTIGATVLIPAQRDLVLARWQRDRATAIESHRQVRLQRHGAYLAALDRGDESVLLSLAGTQLNKSPADRIPLLPAPDPGLSDASVFPSLEPPPLRLLEHPDLEPRTSTLERWATDDKARLWMLAGGVFCAMVGLLPPSRKQAQPT